MLALHHVLDAARFKHLAGVTDGAGVSLLQIRPERHGPRVDAAPEIDRAPGLMLRYMDAVDAAHGVERTDTAAEPAGQHGDLAELTLLVSDLGLIYLEHARRHGDVDVAALPEHVERLLAVHRQPWRDAGLDLGVVEHGEGLALGRDQRRAQHGLEHVGDAFAELRHDLMPAHQCLAR